METINSRISQLVTEKCDGNKSEFARRVGITPAYAAQLCAGTRAPSDRTISDICRIFNVNRRYLEQGEEPMFMPELDPDTDFINTLLEKNDSPFVDVIRAILRVYVELPPEDRKKADAFVASLKEKTAQKDRD